MTGSGDDARPTAQAAMQSTSVAHLFSSLTVISATAQLLARRARNGEPPSLAEIERTADIIVGVARQMAVTLAALDAGSTTAAD